MTDDTIETLETLLQQARLIVEKNDEIFFELFRAGTKSHEFFRKLTGEEQEKLLIAATVEALL